MAGGGAETTGNGGAAPPRATVLIVEDEPAIGNVVATILEDEGYAATLLSQATSEAIRTAVGRLEPDCILLDSTGANARGDFALSWVEAVWAHARRRPVPVVMFTASQEAIREAEAAETERGRSIHAVLAKPFDLDALLDTVARAVGSVRSFDRSVRAEEARTAAMVAQLEAAGATDVRSSSRREWANFYAGTALSIIYWSQRDGVYYVLRQPEDAGAVRPVGRSHDLDAAIALAMAAP